MLSQTIKPQSCPTEPSTPNLTCYFSLSLQTNSHFSDETPCSSPTSVTSPSISPLSDPNNPLLALRRPSLEMASPTGGSVLQLQTSAAHVSRPGPAPLQDMLVTSDDSNDSFSSSGSVSPPLMQTVRCSRCHRTKSIDTSTPQKNGMLQYGINQWYCTRCATIVGYGR